MSSILNDMSAARSLSEQLDQTVVRPRRDERPRVRVRAVIRWCLGVNAATARAAVWALRSCRGMQTAPRAQSLAAPRLPAVPGVPGSAVAGVEHVLWLRAERCLVRAYVLQAWLAAHGEAHDVVIGVRLEQPADLRAHAWLDHEPTQGIGYEEIARIAPSASAARPPDAR